MSTPPMDNNEDELPIDQHRSLPFASIASSEGAYALPEPGRVLQASPAGPIGGATHRYVFIVQLPQTCIFDVFNHRAISQFGVFSF